MDFLSSMIKTGSVAYAMLVLSLVVALGLSLGAVKVGNIHLGVAGVLFSGLIFGHFGISIDSHLLEFLREFGLILFVYTIGIQVGPGFFDSLRRDGVKLNALAASVVVGGAGVALLISIYGQVAIPAAVGMFSGATTNTPSLAAAQQALKEMFGENHEFLKLPALGYAVSYPFGIIGTILAMVLIRKVFRVDLKKEAEAFSQQQRQVTPDLETFCLKVENKNLDGMLVEHIPGLRNSDVVISRISHLGVVKVALPESKIYVGDLLLAVGHRRQLDQLLLVVGSRSEVDLRQLPSAIVARRVIVSRPEVVGKALDELGFMDNYGVTVTRVVRAEIELPAGPQVKLHYADVLLVVGEEAAIRKVATVVGDSSKRIEDPQIIPVFVGIALGVLMGSWPIHLPGMPVPVKLGLAGGPLLAAIILSRVGRIGNLIWYIPRSANYLLREFGISLFLACVGLKSGDQFVATLAQGEGVKWMLLAMLITFVPVALMALWARARCGLNYMSLCGLIAGSMTDPPALAFAHTLTGSNAPAVSYATVYPLVMFLRIILAQMMVVLFAHS